MPYHRPIPEREKKPGQSGFGAIVEAEKLMQIAAILPSAVFVGWLAGAWADHHFHTRWMAVAGLMFGAVSGLVYVIQLAFRVERSTRPGAGNEPVQAKETERMGIDRDR